MNTNTSVLMRLPTNEMVSKQFSLSVKYSSSPVTATKRNIINAKYDIYRNELYKARTRTPLHASCKIFILNILTECHALANITTRRKLLSSAAMLMVTPYFPTIIRIPYSSYPRDYFSFLMGSVKPVPPLIFTIPL